MQLTPDCPAFYQRARHQMTNHAISIDGLIQASEALRNVVRREDVVARRVTALKEMREFSQGTQPNLTPSQGETQSQTQTAGREID